MRVYWIFVSQCFLIFITHGNCAFDPEAGMSVEQIIRKYGYPFEVHADVETEDGYLLDIFRIPYGKNNTNRTRPAILIGHGFGGSSRNYIALGPKKGIAFLLADQGYDVWLMNARGTIVSRKHRTLNPDVDLQFWDYSWHEIGVYDIPACFELIRNVTALERISYVGLSQGTTIFYVFAAERPEYNKNVTVAISFGPQAYMTHLYSPIVKYGSQFIDDLKTILDFMGIREIPPKPLQPLVSMIGQLACTLETLQEICKQVVFAIGGASPDQLEVEEAGKAVAGTAPISVRQAHHYSQLINSGYFRKYDFGRVENLKRYGSVSPPNYNLSKITSPMAVYYSENDWLVDKRDVRRFCKEVNGCALKYKVKLKEFNHFDFAVAKDVIKLVYNNVFKTLARFNENCKENKAC